MSATERVRELLDERGVKWMPVAWNPKKETFYHAMNGIGICADEYGDDVKFYTDVAVTPEQAIEATLGRGECRADETATIAAVTDEGNHVTIHEMECSACGHTYEHVNGDYEYCPHCGRRVVA